MSRGVFTTSTPLTRFDLNDLFDKPRCSVYNDDAFDVPTSTDTVVTFPYENFDIGGLHSTSSNTGRITIPAGCAGLYLLEAQVSWFTTSTAYRIASFMQVNGTTIISRANEPSFAGFSTTRLVALRSLAVGDFVEVYVWQNSGIDVGFSITNHFGAMWLRPTP